ncbi:non-ribosomal peptide synthetase [Nostoc sp. CMAA1605]|uniref:non-ribosomal peptide synthetase n=1 Tax=Nostoc sp. CMAA1605 TaxID=2055159 RepID=UPI001F1777BD|nr:non-ribosomal peptide synthetase [Nostoc sp. CMAA1605]
MAVTEANLVAIDYQIRQLREIQPVTPLFNSANHNKKIEHKDTIIDNISVNLRDKIYKLTSDSPINKLALYLSTIQTLLFKYTAQEEFIVATGALNLNKSDSFIFSRFYRQKIISFKDLLKITRSQLQEGYSHQSYDVDVLVETFLARGGDPAAIFDIALIQEGLCSYSSLSNKFQLFLEIDAQDTSVSITFPKDAFDANFVQRMLGHFLQIIETVTINPDCQLSDIDILTTEEHHQLLKQWNKTETKYAQDKCLHQLFEEQVERSPEAIAVVCENEKITYKQLNEQANQIAHHLQSLGVKAEVLVGICVERSAQMVAGLLGILKAGGAYVPLDPAYPKERLETIVADSQISVLLTQQKLAARLPESQAHIVNLDTEQAAISLESQKNPISQVNSRNSAYVIYTSGSTGKPKGVVIEHHSSVALLCWAKQIFSSEELAGVLAATSICFDLSVFELFAPLAWGGKVIMAQNASYLPSLEAATEVTLINTVPTAIAQLLKIKGIPKSVQTINLAGEALSNQLAQQLYQQENIQRVYNLYGPSEDTTYSTYSLVEKGATQQPSIGKPIANTQIYILNPELQPVPIGIVGELYIGGEGLARGYLNQPELTAQKFISHPFEPGKKLYKTGDLARYLPDGQIEFLGRIDHQVKLRGFRIELGEIESVLESYESVQQAVVILREDTPTNKRLVAYLVTPNQATNVSDVRRFLEQKLPAYMIPAAFVCLEALPLTPNGKVDRKSLPLPEQLRPDLAANFVAPQTQQEKLLSDIWAEILRVEKVGIHNNFFELGGDSILGIQALSKAKQFGLTFSLQQLFQYQTIHKLAKEISQGNYSFPTPKLGFLSFKSYEENLNLPENIEDAYPLTKLQAGMVFHSEYSVDTGVYHDIFTYHLRSPLDLKTLQTAIADLISRHPILRTSFALTEFPQPLQMVHRTVKITLALDDLSHLTTDEQEAAIETWIEQEKKRRFDWSIAPLLRFHIHRRTPETFNFTLSFHHAILDGWSVASFISELFQHYLFLLGLKVPPIPAAPSLTFRDFVALEQQTIASLDCQNYWQEKLQEINVTKLPRWPKSYLSTQTGQIVQQEVNISSEISSGLKQLAKTARVPLKSVLLAAHIRVLNLVTNQTDILTGLVSNGRPEEEDGERVLGLFINTLPFRLQLAGGTWIDLVQQTFKNEHEALPFRRYPLAELQQNLQIKEPLFETLFYFNNFHVYQNLSEFQEIEALESKFFEQTNFSFIVNVSLNSFSEAIELTLKYDPSQFCEQQMQTIGGYYQKALTAMASQWSERYDKHCLLSDTEQHQLLVEWNKTETKYPQDKCIHQLFEEQVERSPEAIAIVCETEKITYKQLNEQANQIAHHLQSLGVKPEVLVGICIERSAQMVAGLLGILKAGGAYVPLDPAYPKERLETIVADSQISVLLTQQKLAARLPESQAHIVNLDTEQAAISLESQKNPISQVNSRNSAYVIYTSGSTGKPKGVVIEHHSSVALLCWAKQIFSSEELAGVLAATSICFDLSVFELFAPLAWGGKVIMAQNASYLPSLEAATEVTLINTVPTAIAQLLKIKGIPKSVQTINLAGEALSNQLAQQLYQQENIQRVYNLYGPSEDTTYSTYSLVEKGATQQPSIGKPIANTQIYILNLSFNQCPLGLLGNCTLVVKV